MLFMMSKFAIQFQRSPIGDVDVVICVDHLLSIFTTNTHNTYITLAVSVRMFPLGVSAWILITSYM